MRKSLKILLLIATSLTFLVVIVVICLPFLIDPNDFKSQIEAAVKEQTGRTLNIEGELTLSVFPWLGISTGQIKLSNAKGFESPYFAQIQQSNVSVKLMPLFLKKLDVSKIVVKGLQVHLSKNKEGITNWADLKTSEDKDTKSSNPLAILGIAGLSLKNATVIWDNQQTGQFSEVKDINLNLDKLAFDQQIPLTLALKVINKQPALTQLVDLSAGLIINEALDRFHLKTVQLNLHSTAALIPTGTLKVQILADVMFDKLNQHFKLSDLHINSEEIKISANIESYFKEQARVDITASIAKFNAINFLQKMEIKLPDIADNKALNNVALDFKLHANPQQLTIDSLKLKVDETTLTANTKISNFSDPSINFNISIDRINADRYLPPKTEKEDEESKKIATPASAAAIGASLFPVEMLRKLNATGNLVIEELKINNLTMQGLALKLDAKEGIIQGKQDIKQFYQGNYHGEFKLDVNPTPTILSLNEQLTNIQIEPLLEDIKGESKMTGSVNISAILTGQGNTSAAIKSSLTGQLSFTFKDGVIKGFNIQKMIDKGKALLKGKVTRDNAKKEQSVFSKISAIAHINNGLVQNDDLLALSSKVRVTGSGKASLMTENIHYQLKAIRIKQKATPTQPEILSSQPVFINVAGTFDNPSYSVDLAAMLLEKNKDKIDKVLDKLDKKIPKKIGDFLKKFL